MSSGGKPLHFPAQVIGLLLLAAAALLVPALLWFRAHLLASVAAASSADKVAEAVANETWHLWVLVGLPVAILCLVAGLVLAAIQRDSRRTIATLRAREDLLRRIIERIPLTCILLARDGRAMQWNPAAERVLGWSAAEAAERPFWELILPASARSQVMSVWERLLDARQTITNINENLTRDGRTVVMEWINTPVLDEGDRPIGFLCMGIDVTERQQAEEARRRTEKMIALGELAGGVAHDFNNMLAGILGFADLIGVRTEDVKARAYAARIADAVGQAQGLTTRLLAFARQGASAPEIFDAHDTVEAALDLFAATRPKSVTVVRSLSAERQAVRGFPSQFQNAVLNLCLNARDAMPAGGRLTVASAVGRLDADGQAALAPYTVLPGDYWILSVSDEGTGMSAQVLARCLEPLFTTKGSRGTGLGLACVHACVSDHRGALRIDSAVGRGTTIHLWLPLAGAVPAIQGADATLPHPQLRAAKRVLVVDDEPHLRQNTVELLEGFGYLALGLPDGEDAVAWVRAHPGETGLVLLDMHMPRLDGARTFTALRELAPGLPVILTTGSTGEPVIEDMRTRGLSGVLTKPMSAKSILDAVSAIVTPERR